MSEIEQDWVLTNIEKSALEIQKTTLEEVKIAIDEHTESCAFARGHMVISWTSILKILLVGIIIGIIIVLLVGGAKMTGLINLIYNAI